MHKICTVAKNIIPLLARKRLCKGMIDYKIWQDRRRRAAKGYPIKFIVYNDGDRIILSTGVYAELELKDGKVNMRETDAHSKNGRLMLLQGLLQDALWELGKKSLTTNGLKIYLESVISGKKKSNSGLFLDYCQEFIQRHTKKGTIITYQAMMNKVAAYDKNVRPDDITVAWMEDFELWMKNQGYATNYYGQIERSIRAVVKHCIKREYSTTDAFLTFRCKKEPTRKRNLSPEQFRMLRDFDCEEYQKEYRDIFCLMVYLRGIAPVDLFTMPHQGDVIEGEYVEFRRQKTGVYVPPVRLEPEAVSIIKRYAGKKYLLNVSERYNNYQDYLHRMNDALKCIGPTRFIGRKGKKERNPIFPGLTSYWARHTWITAAVRARVPRGVAAMAVGQVPKMTLDIYAEYDTEQYDEANRQVIDHLNTKDKK